MAETEKKIKVNLSPKERGRKYFDLHNLLRFVSKWITALSLKAPVMALFIATSMDTGLKWIRSQDVMWMAHLNPFTLWLTLMRLIRAQLYSGPAHNIYVLQKFCQWLALACLRGMGYPQPENKRSVWRLSGVDRRGYILISRIVSLDQSLHPRKRKITFICFFCCLPSWIVPCILLQDCYL